MPDATLTPWPALLPAALAGTRHRPFAPLPGLTPALGSGEAGASEKQLLLTAANLALVQRAGQRFAGPAEDLGRAPAETRPILGAAGTRRLHEVVTGEDMDEDDQRAYRREVGRVGRRLAHRTLAGLLAGQSLRGIGHLLMGQPAELGERGSWLHGVLQSGPEARALRLERSRRVSWWQVSPVRRAQQQYWLGEPRPPDAWQWLLTRLPTGTCEQQRELLRMLRDWQQTELVPPDFEPVLEQLLPDASLQEAADILLAMPGSALAARHWARARPLLTYRPGAARLTIRRAAWDDSWGRDQLPPHWPEHYPPQPDSLAQLHYLLRVVPPARWAETWQLTPAEAVARAAASSHAALVLTGWLAAAERYRDLDFVRPLLAHFAQHPRQLLTVYPQAGYIFEAICLLPGPERAAWLVAQLPARPKTSAADWQKGQRGPSWLTWLVLAALRHPATTVPDLGPALLPFLRTCLAMGDQLDYSLDSEIGRLMDMLARDTDVSLLPALQAELLPLAAVRPTGPLAAAVRRAAHLLALRRELAGLAGAGT